MTVAELRKALEAYPDDMEVFVPEAEGGGLSDDLGFPMAVQEIEVGIEPGTVRLTETHPNYGKMANVRKALFIC